MNNNNNINVLVTPPDCVETNPKLNRYNNYLNIVETKFLNGEVEYTVKHTTSAYHLLQSGYTPIDTSFDDISDAIEAADKLFEELKQYITVSAKTII